MRKSDINSILRKAAKCRHCAVELIVDEDALGLPSPVWIGSKYWNSRQRVALLVQNPSDAGRTEDLAEKPSAPMGDHRDLARSLRRPAEIAKSLDLDLNAVAILTIALCTTADSRYPRRMLRNCYQRFSGELLSLTCPDVLVSFGGNLHDAFRFQLAEVVSPEMIIFLPHESRATADELRQLAESLKRTARITKAGENAK